MKKRKRLEMSLAMRIASEHLSYRALIEEIEGDLERVRSSSPGAMAGLLGLLRSFQAQVRNHFALEERGGLFEVYNERDPAFARQAAGMLAEHRDFLERLRGIVDALTALESAQDPELATREAELRALFADLRAHERKEDELLERLVDQDIRHLV